MNTETEHPEDELRFIACALREWAAWQEACGAYGLLPSPQSAQPHPPPVAVPNARSSNLRSNKPVEHKPEAVAELRIPEPTAKQPQTAPRTTAPDVGLSPNERTVRLAALSQETSNCERCGLHRSRTKTVFGVGPIDVDIMIVGEGPGEEEDIQGVPFVGKAGQLLDRMIAAMGFERSQVFIANVVKCRPPSNRTPTDDEIGVCMPILHEQIALVRPKVLLSMGAPAAFGLLAEKGIKRLRGKWKLYRGETPVMPTYHPAYLLRLESAKREAWADLKSVLAHLHREVPVQRR